MNVDFSHYNEYKPVMKADFFTYEDCVAFMKHLKKYSHQVELGYARQELHGKPENLKPTKEYYWDNKVTIEHKKCNSSHLHRGRLLD